MCLQTSLFCYCPYSISLHFINLTFRWNVTKGCFSGLWARRFPSAPLSAAGRAEPRGASERAWSTLADAGLSTPAAFTAAPASASGNFHGLLGRPKFAKPNVQIDSRVYLLFNAMQKMFNFKVLLLLLIWLMIQPQIDRMIMSIKYHGVFDLHRKDMNQVPFSAYYKLWKGQGKQ